MNLLKQLKARSDQGYRTHPFPKEEPLLPSAFRGLPVLDFSRCTEDCKKEYSKVCPTEAIQIQNGKVHLDLGRCLFCMDCLETCPHGAIQFKRTYSMATSTRADLLLHERQETLKLATKLKQESLRLFGRSLHLRQVSAGGCNGCEVEVNVLNTVVFDLSRFGIQFVASPRHADGILVTGPVTQNMKLALEKTFEAIPKPKLVIAVGACAISGGLFRTHVSETCAGLEPLFPIDLYVPGCPPHPCTILDGLLRILGKRRA